MSDSKFQFMAVGAAIFFIWAIIVTIMYATNKPSKSSTPSSTTSSSTSEMVSNVPNNKFFDTTSIFMEGENTCAGKKLKFENVDCVHTPGPQAGGNVTIGYVGGMEVDVEPNMNHYWASSMCPVNVHWHLGTEHYSLGEYDENGDGPAGTAMLEPASENEEDYHDGTNTSKSFNNRYLATVDELHGDTHETAEEGSETDDSHGVRGGFRCHHYDATDEKFTKPYEWKHCHGMKVGETYEVHWPHSAAGACGTVNQYQTPFYDGVFCNLNMEAFSTLGPQDIASAVGVQAQIYTIVNDESYFYPDMIRGWIIDDVDEMGKDIAYYTGSTTGTSRSNQLCSQYTPITWQVDRKCHVISASSFDKLCYDMMLQRDDMYDDTHAHGSRELVKDSLVANNQARKLQEAKLMEEQLSAEQRHLR